MHVLDAKRAAVGIAQERQDVAQCGDGGAAKATSSKFTIEVPHGQAVCRKVKVNMLALFVFKWIRVSHQVAAYTVGMDELLDAGCFVDVVLVGCHDIGFPTNGLIRDV